MKTLISKLIIIVAGLLSSNLCFSQSAKDSTLTTYVESMDSNRAKIWNKISAHLATDLKFPKEAIAAGIEDATVYVSAILREDGSIVKVKVKKSVGYGFDEEALRVILAMRDFEPVVVDGQPMAVKLVIPVHFKQTEQKSSQTETMLKE